MMVQTHIFIHFCVVVLLFFVKTVIACFGLKRRVGRFAKNRNFTSFLLVLLIFCLMCGWGLAVAYARAMFSCGIQMFFFIISITNIAARNAENSV